MSRARSRIDGARDPRPLIDPDPDAGAAWDKYPADVRVVRGEGDAMIQIRLRRKRRVPPAKVRTFKDLHALEKQAGSGAGRTSPVVITPHTAGQDTKATGSQAGQDIVINHVLV